jgi:Mg2+/Co2+ transporter CorB
MIEDPYISAAIIFFLLLFSAFFSGSETALTAASEGRIHQLSKKGNRSAQTILALREKKERLIGAILLGNNVVNIFASVLATGILLRYFGDAAIIYATLVMTLLILIFAEVLPKTYAFCHADRTALAVAPLVKPLVIVLAPVTHAIFLFVRTMLQPLGIKLSSELGGSLHEEELRGVIDLHEGPAPEIQHERAMLRSILDLDDVGVQEVMTHRSTVTMIDVNDPPKKIIDDVLNSPYTRIPIYRDDPDNITGVVHAKDLLREVLARGDQADALDFGKLATAAWFIPETTTLLGQLHAFRERREHFAIVVDEYGSFMGIVTLEDILEEIVGEIDDEHDIAAAAVRQQADGSYITGGSVTLRDLNRDYEWELPDDESTTIAGLILHESRSIPNPGQIFTFYGFRFEIMRRVRNQITLIRIAPPSSLQANSAKPTH